MKARLSRPLLAIVVGGALLAGGALGAAPAFASDSRESSAAARAALGDEPSGDPTPTTPPVSTPPATPPTSPPTSSEPPPAPSDEPTDPGDPGDPGDPTTPATTDPAPDPTEPAPDPTVAVPDPTVAVPDPTVAVPDPTVPAPDPTEPDPADTTAPTGRFSLSSTSLWVGQRVTLTQGAITDDTSSADQISRVVSWGDGTSSIIYAGQAPIKKQYTKNGRYTITLLLTDAAGNTSKATASANTVSVTTPGKYKLDKYSLWPGQKVKITISSVPAGTSKIRFDWGDGYTNDLRGKNQSFTGLYYHRKNGGLVRGAVTMRATFYNKNGASSAVYVAKVTVKTDSWNPVVKIKKPGSSNRLKSWKYGKGTVTDKGAGVPYVYVWATRINGSKVYCFTPQRKWKRVYSQEEYENCAPIALKNNKGKWSLKLTGLKKGTLYVDAKAWDWADRGSKWASVKANITRS
ncbi:PKD domain-containing protein [Actinoplanes sp. NPDC049548]|uniref:PKD domain-containing protein n=1 Tax=Actinoplanes sp. NPDC049548 TaxID=3155152 RepID=UPI00344A4876